MYRAAVEVVALDRSRLLRDVANALSDHHVNIVACETATGNDRVAKMRFEFELADPGHLAAVIRTIKSINSVYDAYRLVPGRGERPKRQRRPRFRGPIRLPHNAHPVDVRAETLPDSRKRGPRLGL